MKRKKNRATKKRETKRKDTEKKQLITAHKSEQKRRGGDERKRVKKMKGKKR